MIYSFGIDMAKDQFEVCLQQYQLDQQTGHILARNTFDNTPGGYKQWVKWARRQATDPQLPWRVTMEATGVYYEGLALFIQQHHPEIHLAVVLASRAKKYINSQGFRSKTDKIDAQGLALMGAERRLAPWEGIDPYWRELRSITRTRADLMDQRTQLRNQLHALEHSGRPCEQVVRSIQACITTLSEQIKQLTQAIYEQLNARDELGPVLAYLLSIPGVGRLTVATLLAETNGFAAFHSISQLISFSGYDVVVKQSGRWIGKPKISKQGSKYMRRAMYMPANAVIRSKKGPLYDYYQRLLDTHNVAMKAHVAVQKKLLTYVYVLWNKQERFDPQHIYSQRAA